MTPQHPQTDYERITHIIHYLEANFQDQPRLADLAAQVHLSEYHLQRLFTRWAGISPKRFLQYLSAEYAREQLQGAAPTLATAHAVGLSGGGRLHDLTLNIYAMTPGELAEGGAGLSIRYGFGDSPFGRCLVAQTIRGVCWLAFVEPDSDAPAIAEMQATWPNATYHHDKPQAEAILKIIFAGDMSEDTALSLVVKGTNFQVRVWEALLRVPSGTLVTYGHLAQAIDAPKAARAVGSAVGQNAIAYLIPCHRVIRSTGIIGAYRWSSVRKQAMVVWEAAQNQPRAYQRLDA